MSQSGTTSCVCEIQERAPLLQLSEKFLDDDKLQSPELRHTDRMLSSRIKNLKTRLGLVPNYFITRGEAVPSGHTFESLDFFMRKVIEKLFKLGCSEDFRDVKSFQEFQQILQTLGAIVRNGSCNEVKELLNRPIKRNGNTLLHELIQRRQLKFTKSLLLHCGKYIEIDKCNRNGVSALSMAADRLEVETVFLLLLYGADSTESGTCSLGYNEWVRTDLFGNLDTGRWLNKKSLQAVLEHAESNTLSREELFQWALEGSPLSDNVVETLGKLPLLFSITLADGCDAITNNEAWAGMIRHLLTLHKMNNGRESRIVQVSSSTEIKKPIDIPVASPCSDFDDFLERAGAIPSSQRVAGRTIFYSCHDGKDIAIKLSKSLEDDIRPHPLAKEAAMIQKMEDLKVRYELVSDYPTNSQLFLISQLPDKIRHDIKNQLSKGYHHFDVSNSPEGIVALVYYPSKGYDRYVNDPSLSVDDCLSGLNKAAYDFAALARNGLYHGTMVDIQHDASREQRPHLWSFESFLTRFRGGSGRIEGGFSGCSAPNVRASGLADLKHIINLDEIKYRYDPSVIHAQHNLLYDDQERFQVALNEQLGSGLFALTLLAGSSWHARHRNNMRDTENLDLAETIRQVFATFLRGYLSVDKDRADELLRVMSTDFEATSNQIKMFTTRAYVDVAETAPKRPFFGAAAKFFGRISHPTAFVHFSQSASRPLDKPGRCLDLVNAVYQTPASSVLPEGFPRVDTSMMRSSPSWKSGQGWVNKDGQTHFGPYEGVLPFQQLIRDLYAVTYLATMLRTEQQDREEP